MDRWWETEKETACQTATTWPCGPPSKSDNTASTLFWVARKTDVGGVSTLHVQGQKRGRSHPGTDGVCFATVRRQRPRKAHVNVRSVTIHQKARSHLFLSGIFQRLNYKYINIYLRSRIDCPLFHCVTRPYLPTMPSIHEFEQVLRSRSSIKVLSEGTSVDLDQHVELENFLGNHCVKYK